VNGKARIDECAAPPRALVGAALTDRFRAHTKPRRTIRATITTHEMAIVERQTVLAFVTSVIFEELSAICART
jgi:hypothetical protein